MPEEKMNPSTTAQPNFQELFPPGLQLEEEKIVQDSHLAARIESGAMEVLSTPWLIAFMEQTSHKLLQQKLPHNYSSVGATVHIQHLAPTPVGTKIRVQATVEKVLKRTVYLHVQAWDPIEKIGEGEHQRAIIHIERFLAKVKKKNPSP
ncbi:MAG: thioesterase [Planctomycetota bacterium]|nr:MAG: thioesterase [Planctomycetota bacterium]